MKSAWKLAGVGLLCAVPFALAIRDELKPAPAPDRVDRLDEREPDDRPAPPAVDDDDDVDEVARAATAAAAAARSTASAAVAYRPVLGAGPAALGSLFDGVHLGASSQSFLDDAARDRIERWKAEHAAAVDFDFDDRELLGIEVTASAPARDALIGVWGPPSVDDRIWLDGHGQRVALSMRDGASHLHWSRYQTIDQVIAPTDRAHLGIEPFAVVGAPLARLRAALGARLEDNDYEGQYQWTSPPLFNGDDPVVATVVVEGNTIRELAVTADGGDAEAFRAALVARYGSPTTDEGAAWHQARWTGKRTVEATVGEDGLRLSIRR